MKRNVGPLHILTPLVVIMFCFGFDMSHFYWASDIGCGLDFYFPNHTEAEFLFMHTLASWASLLKKCLFFLLKYPDKIPVRCITTHANFDLLLNFESYLGPLDINFFTSHVFSPTFSILHSLIVFSDQQQF